MRDVYTENGFDSRNDYLEYLADMYCAPISAVVSLAELLGADEDFDGLVSSIEDYYG